ncbi:hypothetical protein BU25DRAFT_409986 [Macroventuria anomochaeta]|uniref:Uncharacterized protein n=1 Tax=Macroventuria anomochaeta TaxID=301207 RepID=A0ACB6S2G3_9PLEO|nr:uncharacterized protein BU25DRAFT_409986 [Macroventuria anomochaeta]KAF2628425.1 hypothetical protein BU25DRAFT_409986 [Macroventuria anomochaeta]
MSTLMSYSCQHVVMRHSNQSVDKRSCGQLQGDTSTVTDILSQMTKSRPEVYISSSYSH